ncbi:MAG: VOC family protein [Chloroflexi bacterium]|nr:VOC family protein [Chloroflexota bacterium]
MILLEDLLHSRDFTSAVDSLAHDFRDRHLLPAIYQLGLVVSDVEESATYLETQGIGPFFIAAGAPVFWLERGQELHIRGEMGLGYYRGLEFELLEPTQGSDFYRQSLDSDGRIAVQHLGFLVRDVDGWARRLVEVGYPLWVRGQLRIGPVKVDFAYMDTVGEAGVIIEFISWHVLGWVFRPPAGILSAVARWEKRSGKRSLSL